MLQQKGFLTTLYFCPVPSILKICAIHNAVFNSINWKKLNSALYSKQLRPISFTCLHFVYVFLFFGFDIHTCIMVLWSIINIKHFGSLSISHRLSFLDFYSMKQQSRCIENKMRCFRLTAFKLHQPCDDASAPFQLQGHSAVNISSFFPHTYPSLMPIVLSLTLLPRSFSAVQRNSDLATLLAIPMFRAGTSPSSVPVAYHLVSD